MLENIWSLAIARLFVLCKLFVFFVVVEKKKQAVFHSKYCGKLRRIDMIIPFVFHISMNIGNVGNKICFYLNKNTSWI